MTIYIHPYAITYKDYGSFLETRRGCKLSYDGKTLLDGTFLDRTPESELARMQAVIATNPAAGITVQLGEPMGRTCDMNPHGLI